MVIRAIQCSTEKSDSQNTPLPTNMAAMEYTSQRTHPSSHCHQTSNNAHLSPVTPTTIKATCKHNTCEITLSVFLPELTKPYLCYSSSCFASFGFHFMIEVFWSPDLCFWTTIKMTVLDMFVSYLYKILNCICIHWSFPYITILCVGVLIIHITH